MMGMDVGTWSVSGNQLCIDPSLQWGESSIKVCYNFEFSNNGNTLTLILAGQEYTILTKK